MEMWIIVVCTFIDNEYESLIFPENFSQRCFFLLSEFADVYEKKSEVAHLHNAPSILFRAKFSLEFKWFLSYI